MRLRLFLGMWAVIAVVVGLTVLVHDRLDSGGSAGDQVVSAPDDGAGGGDDGATVVPAEGEVRVHGPVTTALVAGGVLQPREVPTPLTITSERGFGNGAELTSVDVDGEPVTIVWDGGRPFTLASGGALVLDPVDFALVPGGLQLVLGSGNHAFTPGTYRLDTPVAVGREGIATPADTVTFAAHEGSLLEARGDASLLLGPEGGARHFVGPGKVILGGTLEITDADGTHPTDALTTNGAVAAFDLTFTPDGAGGWTVDGVVEQGPPPTLPGG